MVQRASHGYPENHPKTIGKRAVFAKAALVANLMVNGKFMVIGKPSKTVGYIDISALCAT